MMRLGILLVALVLTLPLLAIGLGKIAVDLWLWGGDRFGSGHGVTERPETQQRRGFTGDWPGDVPLAVNGLRGGLRGPQGAQSGRGVPDVEGRSEPGATGLFS